MKSERTLTTGYLLPGSAALAILVAIMGCDPGDPAEPGSRSSDAMQNTDRKQEANGMSGDSPGSDRDSRINSAMAQIEPASGSDVEGTVTFSIAQDDREMQVTVDLMGLEPGAHGLHVHEFGDCSADDASSAGGHFSPDDSSHGAPGSDEHHVGDMGNVEADKDGRVSSELSFRGLAFSGPASVLQKSVVVHRNADDMESEPAGDAGERVGCGVIQADAGQKRDY